MWRVWLSLLFLSGEALRVTSQIVPRDYAVELTAKIDPAVPLLKLQWLPDPAATNFLVSRRLSTKENWMLLATLPGDATEFTDRNIRAAVPFEYQVLKKNSLGFTGAGYLNGGYEIPFPIYRGRVLVVIESTLQANLQTELKTLETDLIGDGWTMTSRTISRDESPTHLRDLIRAEAQANGSLRAVFLLGHVPVAYSGNISPDGHSNHRGAWPADTYFADLDGTWTDATVNTRTAERDTNWNVPGDGKFDPSTIPSDVDVELGRVDLSDLTCFANKVNSRSELDLMRTYLRKDHLWRRGQIPVVPRGLVFDVIGLRGRGPLSDGGWRNFSALVGRDNVSELVGDNYFSRLAGESYLWTYAAGGGTYTSADGVGTSDDFANVDVRAIFTMFIGSYFGDWNEESNFLRAALGSGNILTAAWSGYPHWFFHHMALGETIGFSTRLTQNNSTNGPYLPGNGRARQVHVALMGDPTLRMHVVQPPALVTAQPTDRGVLVEWNPSPDPAVLGYHVFRANSSSGPFELLTTSLVSGRSFLDSAPNSGGTYMVKAIKREENASGSYYNLSQGLTASTPLSQTPTPQSRLTLSSGQALELRLNSTDSAIWTIDFSTDSRTWLPFSSSVGPGTPIVITNRPGISQQFFRARLQR